MLNSGAIGFNAFLGLLVLVPLLLAFVVKGEIERIDRALSELKPDPSGSQPPPTPAPAPAGTQSPAPAPAPTPTEGGQENQPPATEAAAQPDPPPLEATIEPEPPKAGTSIATIVAIHISGLVIRGLLSGMVRRSGNRDEVS